MVMVINSYGEQYVDPYVDENLLSNFTDPDLYLDEISNERLFNIVKEVDKNGSSLSTKIASIRKNNFASTEIQSTSLLLDDLQTMAQFRQQILDLANQGSKLQFIRGI